jgi:hypothetical protein
VPWWANDDRGVRLSLWLFSIFHRSLLQEHSGRVEQGGESSRARGITIAWLGKKQRASMLRAACAHGAARSDCMDSYLFTQHLLALCLRSSMTAKLSLAASQACRSMQTFNIHPHRCDT